MFARVRVRASALCQRGSKRGRGRRRFTPPSSHTRRLPPSCSPPPPSPDWLRPQPEPMVNRSSGGSEGGAPRLRQRSSSLANFPQINGRVKGDEISFALSLPLILSIIPRQHAATLERREKRKKNKLPHIFAPFFQGRVLTAAVTNSSFSFKLLSPLCLLFLFSTCNLVKCDAKKKKEKKRKSLCASTATFGFPARSLGSSGTHQRRPLVAASAAVRSLFFLRAAT